MLLYATVIEIVPAHLICGRTAIINNSTKRLVCVALHNVLVLAGIELISSSFFFFFHYLVLPSRKTGVFTSE